MSAVLHIGGYVSHAIGHRLGATYGIPHGITSVGLFAMRLKDPNNPAVLNACPDHQIESQSLLGGRQTMARQYFAPLETNINRFRWRVIWSSSA